MNNAAFDLAEEFNKKKVEYKLHQPLWDKYDLSAIDLDFNNWNTIKYLNDDATDFGDQIDTIPNDTGGLYIFFIRCKVINGITDFPVYVGKAKLTANQNLRKRCREYFTKYAREDERPLITKMIRYWGKELYLSFMHLGNNDDIVDYEKKLINSLLLPFNTEIPETDIRQAVNAF